MVISFYYISQLINIIYWLTLNCRSHPMRKDLNLYLTATIALSALACFYVYHTSILSFINEELFTSEEKREALEAIRNVNKTIHFVQEKLEHLQRKASASISELGELHADLDFLYTEVDQIAAVDDDIRSRRRELVASLHNLSKRLDQLRDSS